MFRLRSIISGRNSPLKVTALFRFRPLRALAVAVCLLVSLGPQSAMAAGELVFGMSAAFSGPARGLGMEYYRGLMAAFEHINAQGGAGGWRLALSLRDDAYDPAAAMSNTIAFVEQERVFALLGYVGTPTTARVLPLLQHYDSSSMTLLFPLTGADMLRTQPNSACVCNLRASYLTETRHLVDALVAAGRKRIAVFHQADVYGRNGWDGVRLRLLDYGLPLVSEATYRRGAAFDRNFRREVSLVLAGKPDAIITVGTAPACAAFVRDLRGAGFTDLVATLSFADADNLAKLLQAQSRVTGRDYLTGLVFSQVVPSYEDERLPAVRAYRQAMNSVKAPLPPQLTPDEYVPHRLSFVSFEGFLAGMALGEAVSRMGDAPSRERLRSALAGLSAIDLGLGESADLRPGSGQGLRRTYLTVYRGGRFEGVDKLKGVTP
ncbi:MAG: ABC transporter substrate-binding protein [Humidesulfovibrio sp.]|uniref:ABC transporter substrate-binding protein n=1 Tax=Humidesulfovibrio sp. TaxID=2910988 RepID=UPI0027333E87|nr:ABC transporter substrate-binding protein [Humidesulfovibrio sp.]MDP2849071.1 ABC transporter substrate-binding protein [Humidesulfovibrio sp.]